MSVSHRSRSFARILVAVTALAVLAGCSSDAAPEPSTSASAQGASQPDAAGLPELTEAEAQAELQRFADAQAEMARFQFPDLQLPDVQIVRIVTPDEQTPLIVDCLTEQGFTVTLESDGFSGSHAEAQAEAYAIAEYVCNTSYPVDPRYTLPLTAAELETVYRYYVDVQAPCLAAEGYPQPEDPPTLQQFIDSYETAPWTPYEAVGQVGRNAWESINAACSQDVPGLRS